PSHLLNLTQPSLCHVFRHPLHRRVLHSFPTRRSSDLVQTEGETPSPWADEVDLHDHSHRPSHRLVGAQQHVREVDPPPRRRKDEDRKSTRLNSSHDQISYAVFCLKTKTYITGRIPTPL